MCTVVVRVRQYLVLKGHGNWFVKSLERARTRAVGALRLRLTQRRHGWSPY